MKENSPVSALNLSEH